MFGIKQSERRRMTLWRSVIFCFSAFVLIVPTLAAASGIDDEIERLRVAVSEHSAKVFALQRKLLLPADTRLAVFLSLGTRDSLDLDSVELFVNGEPVASHLYSERERGALEGGGIQELFTGNLPNGTHELRTVITARSANDHFVRREAMHRFQKQPGPLRLQMSLDARAPDYEPRVSFVEWK